VLGFLYSTDLLPKDGMEFEQQLTWRHQKAGGDYDLLNSQTEFSYGLTDSIQFSPSIIFDYTHAYHNGTDGTTVPPEQFSNFFPNPNASFTHGLFEGVAFETIWRVQSPYTDPIGIAFLVEPEFVLGTQTHAWSWAFGVFADKIGRRPALLTFQAGAFVMVLLYSQLTDANALLIGGAIMGMFVNGMLGGYGALLSELYPTEARATAENVLFNLGRGVGGFGPVVVGALVVSYSFTIAIALLATIYLLDIVATLLLIPEKKGQPLE